MFNSSFHPTPSSRHTRRAVFIQNPFIYSSLWFQLRSLLRSLGNNLLLIHLSPKFEILAEVAEPCNRITCHRTAQNFPNTTGGLLFPLSGKKLPIHWIHLKDQNKKCASYASWRKRVIWMLLVGDVDLYLRVTGSDMPWVIGSLIVTL